MIITFALIIIPTVFFLMNVAAKLSPAVVVIGVFSALFTLWFYAATACSDPGIVFSVLVPPAIIHPYTDERVVPPPIIPHVPPTDERYTFTYVCICNAYMHIYIFINIFIYIYI
jgi:hypothetical protein